MKDILRAFNPVRLGDLNSFLEKTLLHHRCTANSRGKSPSELLFGRKLRVPVVSEYLMGEEVGYHTNNDSKTTQAAQFVMNKGHNTSYIIKENKLLVASNNQLAAAASSPITGDMGSETAIFEDALHEQAKLSPATLPTATVVDDSEDVSTIPRTNVRRSERSNKGMFMSERYGLELPK